MNPGDQYPEALLHAESRFKETLAERRLLGEKYSLEGHEFRELHKSIVPPYDASKFPNKWRKIDANQPVRTIMAHIGKDSYTHIHYDSEQARTISVREAARLQSFPDGFEFEGAMNSAFRQIGNSVPPLHAKALARSIRSALKVACRR
jgi:DNA (cytosine-5)-methyltransferase 1